MWITALAFEHRLGRLRMSGSPAETLFNARNKRDREAIQTYLAIVATGLIWNRKGGGICQI